MKNLSFIVLSCLAFIACRSSDKLSTQLTAYVLADSTPLTTEPTLDSEVIAFIHLGDTLGILEEGEDGYVKVVVNNHLNGWIDRTRVSWQGHPCSFTSPVTAYRSPDESAITGDGFYPLDYALVISTDGSGWSEVIGMPATRDTILRAWVLSESITTADREVLFTVAYKKVMTIPDSAKRETEILKLLLSEQFKASPFCDIVRMADAFGIHADDADVEFVDDDPEEVDLGYDSLQ